MAAKEAVIENTEKVALQAVAHVKSIRVTARKARLVVDIIRNKNVDDAEAILINTNKRITEVITKLLKSAIANAEYKGMDRSKLYISSIYANEGSTLKRFRPRAKGSASPIMKRTSHITIVLEER